MLPRATLAALGLLGYTYAGYPALIGALAKLRPHHTEKDASYLPSVSVLMAAYNAEAMIGAKLDTLQALDYPADKLEIVVLSDGSSDRTDAIVAARAALDPRIVALRSEERRGKPSAINSMRRRAKGEVLLMCDVRQRFDPAALRALVRWLRDPSVGCVSGNLVMEGDAGSGVYWRYEKWIREREAAWRSVPGVTGAIYVLRATDLEDIPEDTILDDVLIPMRLRLRGKKVLFDPEAKAFDAAADDDKEFGRKARTLAGNFQLFARVPRLLVPIANPSWLETVSHKALRLAGPWLLATLAASSLGFAVRPPRGASPRSIAAVRALALAQLAFYAGAALGPRAGKLGNVARTFVVMNAAAAVGLGRFLRGRQRVTW
ncbi:MAG: glycosyltransferase family 2 protein [Polyangiaceae bacterium]|jgi:biofilm PGA synthesis N-glycosyltransferase PgaC|nr:glycosyltransferase family 2 protein [Polyangiaceae bacterium]